MSFWKIATTVLLALSLAMAPGCEDTPAGSTETAVCSDSADPIFLRSKTDDDDGDGIILDEDFPTINDEDDDIADHAWVRDNIGIYHLFFQNEGLGSGSDIEHYTSVNLQSLDYVGVALARNPGAWDADNLWAPDIVQNGGMYYMFYTGVEGSGPTALQRIGIATSTDLMSWTRLGVNYCPGTSGDGCVYECDEGWTTWSDPVESFNQQ
ncbi:MAG: family 43 glycosylhydrolase, partial [Candidatus Krumholzibacteriota bacterium]|nr:family 43 glycosylhydrolase [Candidatus Krumholzibacteriota bacterium]